MQKVISSSKVRNIRHATDMLVLLTGNVEILDSFNYIPVYHFVKKNLSYFKRIIQTYY